MAAAQVQDGAKLDNRYEDQRDAPNTLPNLFPGKAGDEAEQRWRRPAHDARGREPTRPGHGSSVTTTECTSGSPFVSTPSTLRRPAGGTAPWHRTSYSM